MPGVAPAAMQMGAARRREHPPRAAGPAAPAVPLPRQGLAGDDRARAAVADLGRLKLRGFLAWLAWLVIHIFFLIGFRNRLVVLFEWAWAYFTYQRSARLILDVGPRR